MSDTPRRDPPFVCPACRSELAPAGGGALPSSPPAPQGALQCPADGAVYREVDGVWRFLTPAREAELTGFLSRYAAVRRDEGWGSDDGDYYRALPFRDTSGRHPQR